MPTSEKSSFEGRNPNPDVWAEIFEKSNAQSLAYLQMWQSFWEPRTLRKQWLDTMSQQFDTFLRSPAFAESMKNGLKAMTDFKTYQNQIARDFAGLAGVPTASDIHELTDLVRRKEAELSAKLQEIEKQLSNFGKTKDSEKVNSKPEKT